VLASAHAPALASLTLSSSGMATELAMDPAGRWRAESRLGGTLASLSLRARVRGGLPRLGALPDAARPIPAHALAVALGRDAGPVQLSAFGALWRFRPGLDGARGALAMRQELPHHQRLALGLEEQHGRRRDALAAAAAVRQGMWGEWRGGPPGLRLALRSEGWGEGPWLRGEVRRASFATLELNGPARSGIRIAHGAYRTRAGESLYLAEAESDRLVLRALRGSGERTRLDVTAPFAEGRVRAAMGMTAAADRPPRLLWSVDWTRRLSTRRPGRERAPPTGAGPDPEEDR
jgi:hypothetical protein